MIDSRQAPLTPICSLLLRNVPAYCLVRWNMRLLRDEWLDLGQQDMPALFVRKSRGQIKFLSIQ